MHLPAGRSGACRPDFPRTKAYANFSLETADLSYGVHVPGTAHMRLTPIATVGSCPGCPQRQPLHSNALYGRSALEYGFHPFKT